MISGRREDEDEDEDWEMAGKVWMNMYRFTDQMLVLTPEIV